MFGFLRRKKPAIAEAAPQVNPEADAHLPVADAPVADGAADVTAADAPIADAGLVSAPPIAEQPSAWLAAEPAESAPSTD